MSRAQKLLYAIAASFLVAGLVEPHLPNPGQTFNEIGIAHTFVLAVLLFAWCKADAVQRGIAPPTAAPLLVGIAAPLGVPYYFFRALPWRAATVATVKACGFILACAFLAYAASFVSRVAL
jgi:hypothetical protein